MLRLLYSIECCSLATSAGMCLDEALLQGIGAAHQLAEAEFPVDTPPKGFLTFLKTGLGGHLKAHGYKYRKMLDEELAKIKVSLLLLRLPTSKSLGAMDNRLESDSLTASWCCLQQTAAEGAAGTCVCADWVSAGSSPHRLRKLHRPRALQERLRRRVRKEAPAGKKTISFLHLLHAIQILSPRQARDKRRKAHEKDCCLQYREV
jgi:hypothetical protein